MKNLLFAIGFLVLVSVGLLFFPSLAGYGEVSIFYFLPWIGAIFILTLALSERFGHLLEQPPIMVFILTMVVKVLASLTVFLVYLMNHLGPPVKGAVVFILIYLIFEFLEIKRFLSILRPDSRENP